VGTLLITFGHLVTVSEARLHFRASSVRGCRS
jgi:hypothetical protein